MIKIFLFCALVGIVTAGAPHPHQIAGQYKVYYNGKPQNFPAKPVMTLGCNGSVRQPLVFSSRMQTKSVRRTCPHKRDSRASWVFRNSKTSTQYECLRLVNSRTIRGNHYMNGKFWGRVEYRLIKRSKKCNVRCKCKTPGKGRAYKCTDGSRKSCGKASVCKSKQSFSKSKARGCKKIVQKKPKKKSELRLFC